MMNRRMVLAAMAGMSFGGHHALAAGKRSVSGLPPSEMPAAMDAALRSVWMDVERPRPASNPAAAVQWNPRRTPLLPLSWPPDGRTTWVSHLYASGFDPRLSDAERVAAPWGRLRIDRDPFVPVFEPGSGRVEDIGIQGTFMVQPAPAEKADEAEAARVLTWIGVPADSERVRAFYRDWAYWNGRIRGLVQDEHAAFFDWLGG